MVSKMYQYYQSHLDKIESIGYTRVMLEELYEIFNTASMRYSYGQSPVKLGGADFPSFSSSNNDFYKARSVMSFIVSKDFSSVSLGDDYEEILDVMVAPIEELPLLMVNKGHLSMIANYRLEKGL
jgi:hypothetical protein